MANNLPPLPESSPMFTEEQRQALGQAFDREFPNQQVKRARDRAQYVRNQKGHSLTFHLLFGWVFLWIPAIYFTFSPNHYWKV